LQLAVDGNVGRHRARPEFRWTDGHTPTLGRQLQRQQYVVGIEHRGRPIAQ